MNVIVLASRKGGTGKSTLAAHLAAHCDKTLRSCLLIDSDPQGSLTFWHGLRQRETAPLRSGLQAFATTLGDCAGRGRRMGAGRYAAARIGTGDGSNQCSDVDRHSGKTCDLRS